MAIFPVGSVGMRPPRVLTRAQGGSAQSIGRLPWAQNDAGFYLGALIAVCQEDEPERRYRLVLAVPTPTTRMSVTTPADTINSGEGRIASRDKVDKSVAFRCLPLEPIKTHKYGLSGTPQRPSADVTPRCRRGFFDQSRTAVLWHVPYTCVGTTPMRPSHWIVGSRCSSIVAG